VKQGINSLEIGISVFDAVVRARRPLRLMEVAEGAGLSPSKARMYLISLIRTGMVEQDEKTSTYRHGARAARLGLLALRSNGLLNAAQDYVIRLAGETGNPVLLSCWDNDRSLIVFASETSNALPIAFRIGRTTSLAHTATGRTFLAYKSADEVATSLKSSGVTVVTRGLREELAGIRRTGYAIVDVINLQPGISLNGLGAIAAPIFGSGGEVEFVITVLYRTSEHRNIIATLASRVCEEAKSLSLNEGRT
jgi:DNA-binding IclR family transcriptional regulator